MISGFISSRKRITSCCFRAALSKAGSSAPVQGVGLAPITEPHANRGFKEPSLSNGHGDEGAATDVSRFLEILGKE